MTTTEEFPEGPGMVAVQFAPPDLSAQFKAMQEHAAGLDLMLNPPTVDETPCYLVDEDGEPVAVRQWFMVEDETGEGTWVLRRRVTESGFGSPLIWADRNQVAEQLRIEALASGCFGDSRVITVMVTHRDAPEILCVYCKEWGHVEQDCEELTDDGQGQLVRKAANLPPVANLPRDIEIDLAKSDQGTVGGPA